ncbi:hypothetical protein H8356DRAFT_1324771 [Neocallimastix lanati (nom. inval.)]|nr:hypothetical protein H8356DRAFT_1324771 [Neocallimastix sp. JGI-2020a]
MDFIIDLLIFNDFNCILVILDCSPKCDTSSLSQMFFLPIILLKMNTIFRLHDLPIEILSDYEGEFCHRIIQSLEDSQTMVTIQVFPQQCLAFPIENHEKASKKQDIFTKLHHIEASEFMKNDKIYSFGIRILEEGPFILTWTNNSWANNYFTNALFKNYMRLLFSYESGIYVIKRVITAYLSILEICLTNSKIKKLKDLVYHGLKKYKNDNNEFSYRIETNIMPL